MTRLLELTNLITKWSIDRNLHTTNPNKQILKLIEEFGELASGIAKNKKGVVIDSIGDIYVVITIMMQQMNDIHMTDILLTKTTQKAVWSDNPYKRKTSEKNIGMILHNIQSLYSWVDFPENQNFKKEKSHKSSVIWILKSLDNIAKKYDTNLEHCVDIAYNEIQERKGRMIDGVFVKESDL